MKRLITLSLMCLLLLTSCEEEESDEVTANLDDSIEIELDRGTGVMHPEIHTVEVIAQIEFNNRTVPLAYRNFTVTPNCPSRAYEDEYTFEKNRGVAGTYTSNEEGRFEFRLPPNNYCISSKFTFNPSVEESPPICIKGDAYHLSAYVYAGDDKTVTLGNESLVLERDCPTYP